MRFSPNCLEAIKLSDPSEIMASNLKFELSSGGKLFDFNT